MDYVRMEISCASGAQNTALTERQLAKFAGISPVYYSQIERGVCHIDLETRFVGWLKRCAACRQTSCSILKTAGCIWMADIA